MSKSKCIFISLLVVLFIIVMVASFTYAYFVGRTDENNVNIDEEMSDLSKNQIYYNVLSQRATVEINKLRSAIQDA